MFKNGHDSPALVRIWTKNKLLTVVIIRFKKTGQRCFSLSPIWILQIVATSVISSIFSTIVTMNWFFKFTFFGWTLSFWVSGSWNETEINMSRIIKLSRIRNNFDSTLVWNYRGEFARYTESYFQTFYIIMCSTLFSFSMTDSLFLL